MLTDMQKLVRDYKAGRISEEEIKELEKDCGKNIEEIVDNINKILYLKKHRLDIKDTFLTQTTITHQAVFILSP